VSPDEKHLAYSTLAATAPNSQQNLFDLHVLELASGADRVLVPRAHLTYGMEVSWSPDGRRLAYLANGPLAHGEVVVAALDGAVTTVSPKPVPGLDIAGGELPPLWDDAGTRLFGVGADGRLWVLDAAGGAPRSIAVEGFSLTRIVPCGDRRRAWPGDGRTVWAMGRSQDGERMGFCAVDLERATGRVVLVEAKSYTTFSAYAGDSAGAAIAFVPKDQQHPGDVWVLDARTGQARQVSHLNPDLERYELGAARLIDWLDAGGRPLRGALLLPPGCPDGRRVPLVVSVYGGSLGSKKLNVFGFSGLAPALNMQVLATHGFAVLHPDAPLRPGHQLRDLYRTVMPGVNAAIEKGFADPDRLAITGQSFGAWSSLALIGQSTRFKAALLQAAVTHPDAIADYLRLAPDGSDGPTGYYEEGQGNMTGHPWAVRDRYLENSPVFLFDRIETPVLILQGARDGGLAASDAIFVGLRRLGKTVEYRLYEGEGHVPQQRANVIDSWKRRIEFLDEHLDLTRDAAGRIVYDGERARSRRTPPAR
jgi:dipeptidyl aminopeptidase/acylaminoacyl peptidase